MSFQSHKIQSLASSSNGKSDPAINYVATWRLFGWDDTENNPTFSDVYSHLRANSELPYHGRAFRYDSFRDSTAVCVGIDPELVKSGENIWDVRATYESIKPDKQERPDNTEKGEKTEDPFKWRRECSVSWSQTSIAVEQAFFRGYSRPVGNRWLKPGRLGAIVNSCLQPLDVQHMMESDQQSISISRYVQKWDNDLSKVWIGAVNRGAFKFNLNDLNGQFFFEPLTLKVREFGATSDFINGRQVWRQTIQFLYNPKGWRLQVLDMGFGPRQFPGDIKQGTTSNEIVTEEDYNQYGGVGVFTDANGNPSAVPRLLNGNGSELQNGFDPVFLIYQIYTREDDFAALERLL